MDLTADDGEGAEDGMKSPFPLGFQEVPLVTLVPLPK